MEVEFPPLLTRFKPCSGIPVIRLESKTGTPSLSETRSFFSMPSEPNVVVIIPARWASVRFPGKPLAEIREKPMILWVVEKARQAERTSEVIVATDDQRIFEAVNSFGGKVVMTSAEHVSGSDRIAEVASGLNCDIVVNVQGDEPLMPPENIDRVVQALVDHPDVPVSTLMVPITSREEIADPNVVKVVVDKKGRALYFSRSAIPFRRDAPSSEAQMTGGDFPGQGGVFKHLGLYAYRRSFLLEFTCMSPTPLELAEKLEQLRILENGYSLQVVQAEQDSIGVDRKEDLVKIEQFLTSK